jgi:hypothetical protein
MADPLSPRAAPATGPQPEPGDETTACADCKHQPYDHGERGCRVVQRPGHPCGCDRRRTVLDRANEIGASITAPASPPPEPAEERSALPLCDPMDESPCRWGCPHPMKYHSPSIGCERCACDPQQPAEERSEPRACLWHSDCDAAERAQRPGFPVAHYRPAPALPRPEGGFRVAFRPPVTVADTGTGQAVTVERPPVVTYTGQTGNLYAALPRPEEPALREALGKVNAIRNSIIGLQKINWSEHIYPLVAVLNEAGFVGMPYPEARENYGTMLERTLAAEAEVARLRALSAPPPGEERLRERVEAALTKVETEADSEGSSWESGAKYAVSALRAALREDEKGAKP